MKALIVWMTQQSTWWKVGHFGYGALVPALFALFVPIRHNALIGALLISVAWAVPKEFYFDIRDEHATYLGGFFDWLEYASGSALVLFGLWLRGML